MNEKPVPGIVFVFYVLCVLLTIIALNIRISRLETKIDAMTPTQEAKP
jgi:hypothetical protein